MVKISLQNVDVSLPVFGPNGLSLRSKLSALVGRGGASNAGVEVVHAIRDMSIELNEGDRIGLRGPNGAGKSTFLRLVGGIYQPTAGSMTVSGTRRTLFGLASGMEMEATGWENIRIGARRIGVPKSALDEVCDDVAEFSELGESLDRPIRTYSQGMLLRLGFGVMTSKPADIILIDEVIGVGDTKFMERANARMERFADQAKILILASHSNDIIEKFCNQILTFESGKIAKRIFWDRLENTVADEVEKQTVDEENEVVEIQESFSEAIRAAGNQETETTDPAIPQIFRKIKQSPLSQELHGTLGSLYCESGNMAAEWIQKKNQEALAYIADEKSEPDNLEISEPGNVLDFSFTRSAMCSLVDLLSVKAGADNVILSLNSPWYGFSSKITGRKLLTFHSDVNGVTDFDGISFNGRVQCIAVIGPSPEFDLNTYRTWLHCAARAGVPYFAVWLRWSGCADVMEKENELNIALANSGSNHKYFSEKDARLMADLEGVKVEVTREGRYLQAISEWLASCPRGNLDHREYQKVVERLYKAAYAKADSLEWPHGYWALFSTSDPEN